MCCFSGPVESVGDTSIFARRDGDGRQILVYGMSYAASAELAMVLPLPVASGSGEEAVSFVSLQAYPEFFGDLHALFVRERDYSTLSSRDEEPQRAPPLPVHDVGAFDASFVPTPRDFVRLDERFRLPADLWRAMPEYADYGFAVFKLKASMRPKAAHPMALKFRSRAPETLFFPTVHVHDGEVRKAARFDHALYVQLGEGIQRFPVSVSQEHGTLFWNGAWGAPTEKLDIVRTAGLVDAGQRIFRLQLQGRSENRDTWVGADNRIPERIPTPEEDALRFAEVLSHADADRMAAWHSRMEADLAAARVAGATWLLMRDRVPHHLRSEAEVEALLGQPAKYLRIYTAAKPFAEQPEGLSRLQWLAGDR